MPDSIDTERALFVAEQLGGLVRAAVEMRGRFVALGHVLDSEGVFGGPTSFVDEFVDEVGQTEAALRLAVVVVRGADGFSARLDEQLEALAADVADGVGFTASDDDRRRYFEGQFFTGYRGVAHGAVDDGAVTDQELAAVRVLIGQLSASDVADYWSALPAEERRRLIQDDPDRVAEHVIAAGGTLTAEEQAGFAAASARYIETHGEGDFGDVGSLEPGDEIDVLGLLGDGANLLEVGAEVVVAINGVPVAIRVASVAGDVGTVAGGVGVIAECHDGVDDACIGAGVVFVIDAIGSTVLGPVVYNAVKYGAIGAIVLIGLAQEQSPDIQPDWVGSGGAPGVLPYDTDDIVSAPTTGRNDGGAGNGQAGRVMADAIGDYCRTTSDESVCGWGN